MQFHDHSYNMSLFKHVTFICLCTKSSTQDAFCCLLDRTQTVIHWPTELQKPEELLTNLITDGISLSLSLLIVCVSFCSQTQKNTYLETLRQRRHCHDQMYWNVHFTSTENAGQYQSQETDKPSNKDSILSGYIQKRKKQHKSRQAQDTDIYG